MLELTQSHSDARRSRIVLEQVIVHASLRSRIPCENYDAEIRTQKARDSPREEKRRNDADVSSGTRTVAAESRWMRCFHFFSRPENSVRCITPSWLDFRMVEDAGCSGRGIVDPLSAALARDCRFDGRRRSASGILRTDLWTARFRDRTRCGITSTGLRCEGRRHDDARSGHVCAAFGLGRTGWLNWMRW